MLRDTIGQFLDYCRLSDFSGRSLETLTTRLNELNAFLQKQKVGPVQNISYIDLISFVADFNDPSVHVRKSRVWTLRQFFHFLTLQRIVEQNIAIRLPYPKIEKTVPHFLTQEEFNCLLGCLGQKAEDIPGIRNLLRKVRTLPLNEDLIKILSDYIAVREHIFLRSITSALFVSKKGNPLSGPWRIILKKYC